MSVEFLVFARFKNGLNEVFMKDCKRGYSKLEDASVAERNFKEAGGATSMVLFTRGENVIYIRRGFQ